MFQTTLTCNIPYHAPSRLTYLRACGVRNENELLCLAKSFIISLQSTYFPAATCYVLETYCPLHKGSFHAVISFVLLCRKTEFQLGHSVWKAWTVSHLFRGGHWAAKESFRSHILLKSSLTTLWKASRLTSVSTHEEVNKIEHIFLAIYFALKVSIYTRLYAELMKIYFTSQHLDIVAYHK